VKKTACAAVLLMLAVGGAEAQPARQQQGPAAAQNPEGRDELFKVIDAYVVSSLQDSLGLSDDQFVRVLPPLRRLQSVRREYAARRRQTMNELRRVLASGNATELRVADLMRNLKSMELEEPGAVRREADAVDALLTPVQQAKLRLLEVRVEQRLRELMLRGQGQGPAGQRRNGLPNPTGP